MVLVVAGCGGSEPSPPPVERSAWASSTETTSTAVADFPDVLVAMLTSSGDGYSLSVTMSSEYDTPQRYADGWRVLDPDGNEVAAWELAHDHAGEQPFTRTQTGLEIPGNIAEVTVEGRDLKNGYGGGTVTVPVP